MSDAALVATQILWDVALLIVIAVIVPLVIYRCIRLVRGARGIAVNFHATLQAAAGVAANTAPTGVALDQTIAVATDILATAGQIDGHAAAIEGLLQQRAALEARR
ncbi:MAG: hypothetical protein ACYDAC_05170 [Candidatus Dormibacteria bacterium]